MHANVSLSDGHRNLQSLLKQVAEAHTEWNEANTRFHLIDRLLIECLGWSKDPDKFQVEVHTDGEFRDYVLGSPPAIIWEAKRSGLHFNFPADADKKSIQSIR